MFGRNDAAWAPPGMGREFAPPQKALEAGPSGSERLAGRSVRFHESLQRRPPPAIGRKSPTRRRNFIMERCWQKSCPMGAPSAVDVKAFGSIAEMFEQSAAKYRQKPAYVHMGAAITYAEVE